MSVLLFGTAMVLAAFLVVNVAASAAVMAATARAGARRRAERPRAGSRRLFILRLLPALAAAAIAGGLVTPAYFLLEPANPGERLSGPLGALALGGLALLIGGAVRGARAAAATATLLRRWGPHAEAVRLRHSPVPAYRVRDARPVFAVVGLLRPRIYVSTKVLDALTPSEVAAAGAHEEAHLSARDNLKRLLMRSAPDLLALFGTGRTLEREWARAAETEADERAARGRGDVALALAAGLVKVARLAPVRGAPLAVSALHDGGDVEERVRRLVALAGGELPEDNRRTLALWVAAAATGTLGSALAVYGLPLVHRLIEVAARFLA